MDVGMLVKITIRSSMDKLTHYLAQFFWFGFALVLWGIETGISLFVAPRLFIKNLREFPDFLSYLTERCSDRLFKR